MPEMKRQFTGGKMNKDLDDRLVPNGEYRDAMNIQVSTSEGSDVGTVQNILGNKDIYGLTEFTDAVCVGAIADEKNDKLYWFVSDSGATAPFDGIFEYTSNGGVTPVLIDTNLDVLKFNPTKIITGINIIDDMLFWTDNANEPRKINITRSKQGTNGITHTKFKNLETDIDVNIREEHITVIKKGPKTSPTVKLVSDRSNDLGKIYTGVMSIAGPFEVIDGQGGKTDKDGWSSSDQRLGLDWNANNESSMWFPRSPLSYHYDFSQLGVGDYFDTYIETDINGESGFELDWSVGDTILFEAFGGENYDQPPSIPLRNYSVKARIHDRKTWIPDNIYLIDSRYTNNAQPDFQNQTVVNVSWKQGPNINQLKLYYKRGFDARITQVNVYQVVNGIPNVSTNLCPNPNFQVNDVNGNLPKWYSPEHVGCLPHGPYNPEIGDVYELDSNGNPTTTLIDPDVFPCYPDEFAYNIYPAKWKDQNGVIQDHPKATQDTIEKHKYEGPWHIVHDNSGGYAQAGGAGKDNVQIDNDLNNYGGLITNGGNFDDPNIDFIGSAGINHWRQYANSSQITAADGYSYTSGDIINQSGYMYVDMPDSFKCANNALLDDGSPNPDADTGCFGANREYTIEITLTTTGHGNEILRGDGTGNGFNTKNGNGQVLLANHGESNIWNRSNYFIDQPKEVVLNGDFSEPNATGNLPRYWTIADAYDNGSVEYNFEENYVELGRVADFNTTNLARKLSTNIPFTIETDQTYRVTFELFDIQPDSEGVHITLVGQPYQYISPTEKNATWKTPDVKTEGVHEFEVVTSLANSLNMSGQSSGDRIYFGNQYHGGTDPGFRGKIRNISIKRVSAPNANVSCEVLAIHNPPTSPDGSRLKFAVDLDKSKNRIFEFKFPRFAYRYKYADNEYSTISPFSSVGFIPGQFIYDSKQGYNLGMTNRLTEAIISNFKEGIPDGVVAVDILYKDDASPNVYIVDTIKPKHTILSDIEQTIWDQEEYSISTEQIYRAISSNQLLRPWDAVPQKALAQDVTGNRIVYGNYVQGFDLTTVDINEQEKKYYPDFNFDVLSSENLEYKPQKSLKSLREYQLGIVFADEYGRETPVISSYSGTKTIEKEAGKMINQLQVGFGNESFPTDMKYFKFFVKETSNEYYNLAMDRWYDAEDGGAWLAFPSSDRNKVDIDTFLILKKPINSNSAVLDETKYKILDIQDNAPAFIRQNKSLISSSTHNFTEADTVNNIAEDRGIFGNSLVDVPIVGSSTFKLNYAKYFDTSGSDLHKIDNANLYVDFESVNGDVTNRYKIAKITCDFDAGDNSVTVEDAQYSIFIDGAFGDEINSITDDPLAGVNPTLIKDGTVVNIYKYNEESLARFDGRFFVKINIDADFNEQLLASQVDLRYRRVQSKKLYYLSATNSTLHSTDLTGQALNTNIKGEYQNVGFTSIAPFFRNYNRPADHIQVPLLSSGGGNLEAGAFVFGEDSATSRNWLKELAWVTMDASKDFPCPIGVERKNTLPSGGVGAGETWPGVKIADDHGWSNKEKADGVFSANGEQEKGDVWFIDGASYFTEVNQGPRLQWTKDFSTPAEAEEARIINENSGFGSGIQDGSETPIPVSYSTLDISVGSLYHSDVHFGRGNTPITDFWNIGKTDGNPTYSGLNGIINQLQPGRKFRFREDPTGEIYTIQEDVQEINRIRYATIPPKPTGTGSAGRLSPFYWAWYSGKDKGSISYNDVGWDASYIHPNPEDADASYLLDNKNGDCMPDRYASFSRFARQLSPNFSKTWRPKVLNSSGRPNINWNPINDVPQPITNGLKLEVFHSNVAASTAIPNVSVVVDSLIGTNSDGTKHNITVGMILTSHSDGATDCVFDGSTAGKEYLAIHKIERESIGGGNEVFRLHLTGYSKILVDNDDNPLGYTRHKIFNPAPTISQKMIFEQPTMNGYSQYSVNRINAQDPTNMNWSGPTIDDNGEVVDYGNPGIMAIGYNLDFVEEIDLDANLQSTISENPAIWETEPKDAIDLDLYYEASGYYPLKLNDYSDASLIAPYGSKIESLSGGFIEEGTIITASESTAGGNLRLTLQTYSDTLGVDFTGVLVGDPYLVIGDRLKITKPNGEAIIVEIKTYEADEDGRTSVLEVHGSTYGKKTNYILNWHNCYSFGNGVESNRIRDNFNLPFISNGAKVSTVFDGDYAQEHRKYGLIYSGLYNSNSGINNLNQFIVAEKITKDINPIYGSIQKLHSRDSDLITLCEDKCLKILANKDALFNADGNANITATSNVLGQTIPFSGEYGISKNPESFASESYRIYFTDKVRGAVMRLSKDGLTPISEHGMKAWFRDNLKLSTRLIGSYDDRQEEYNITLKDQAIPKTVSFQENVRGWVSFKSFIPEFGISLASNYYTMFSGRLYKHHSKLVDRNSFYSDTGAINSQSTVTTILNESPGIIKTFHTLNYEGSQAKIDKFVNQYIDAYDQPGAFYNNQKQYNLSAKSGWFVDYILTDKDTGNVNDFIEKEGKWFNNIDKSIDLDQAVADASSFSFQGIGELTNYGTSGCTDPTATNYDSLALVNDGSCEYDGGDDDDGDDGGPGNPGQEGCAVVNTISVDAFNVGEDGVYLESACATFGGIGNVVSFSFAAKIPGYPMVSTGSDYGYTISASTGSIISDNQNVVVFTNGGSFPGLSTGDFISVAYSYTNVDGIVCDYTINGSPVDCGDDDGPGGPPPPPPPPPPPITLGCTDDGSDPNFLNRPTDFEAGREACNYDETATIDDGSCEYTSCLIIDGCTDSEACNYDPLATDDDGSCEYVSCNPTDGCTDDGNDPSFPGRPSGWVGPASNYSSLATNNDGSCYYEVLGCTDPNATNYDQLANTDDGSCTQPCPTPLNVSVRVSTTTNLSVNKFAYLWIIGGDNFDSAGAAPPHTWSWEDPQGNDLSWNRQFFAEAVNPNSLTLSPTISFLDRYTGDGDYKATVIDANGCSASDTVYIELGCTDPTALNYNPNATYDSPKKDSSGQYIYPTVAGGECEYGTNPIPCENQKTTITGLVFRNNANELELGSVTEGVSFINNPYKYFWYDPNGDLIASHVTDDDLKVNTYQTHLNIYLHHIQQVYKGTPSNILPFYAGGDGVYKLEVVSNTGCVSGDSFEIIGGCMDNNYLEYNPNANLQVEGACETLPSEPTTIVGCMDPTALNYNPEANIQGELDTPGACDYGRPAEGCLDENASNYVGNTTPPVDSYWVHDQEDCEYVGCTNEDATNYDPYATVDDKSCLGGGCTYAYAKEYDKNATFDDCSCSVNYGCTDPTAINFNKFAQHDNGICIYKDLLKQNVFTEDNFPGNAGEWFTRFMQNWENEAGLFIPPYQGGVGFASSQVGGAFFQTASGAYIQNPGLWDWYKLQLVQLDNEALPLFAHNDNDQTHPDETISWKDMLKLGGGGDFNKYRCPTTYTQVDRERNVLYGCTNCKFANYNPLATDMCPDYIKAINSGSLDLANELFVMCCGQKIGKQNCTEQGPA